MYVCMYVYNYVCIYISISDSLLLIYQFYRYNTQGKQRDLFHGIFKIIPRYKQSLPVESQVLPDHSSVRAVCDIGDRRATLEEKGECEPYK